jgi:hypothetical protein
MIFADLLLYRRYSFCISFHSVVVYLLFLEISVSDPYSLNPDPNSLNPDPVILLNPDSDQDSLYQNKKNYNLKFFGSKPSYTSVCLLKVLQTTSRLFKHEFLPY